MIRVDELSKTFETKAEKVSAITSIGFEVGAGEIITLLGPSGCGKTTTLRCIAGLERPTAGRIVIGERPMVDCASGLFVPPHRRDLGMVFQSYAIWPHMTVFDNVAYALEGRHLGRAEIKARTLHALETVQMAHLADRPAPRLSGGQQQRVAIARALVSRPRALLFDEPLSNLDAKLRSEMRKELRRLQRQIGLTSVYVTHDQSEALAISDRIVVMKDGRVVEVGTPTQIYRAPRHVFTAQFLGTTNLVPGKIEESDPAGGRVGVATPLGRFVGTDPSNTLKAGTRVQVSIRPEDIVCDGRTAANGALLNHLEGTVEFAIFAGNVIEAEVRCGDTKIQCFLGRNADSTPGAAVSLRFSAEDCLVLPDQGNQRNSFDSAPGNPLPEGPPEEGFNSPRP